MVRDGNSHEYRLVVGKARESRAYTRLAQRDASRSSRHVVGLTAVLKFILDLGQNKRQSHYIFYI